MITILQIIPSLGAGGAEQACVDVAAGITMAGYRSIVVSSGGPRVAEILKAGGEHITRSVHIKNPMVMLANALWLAHVIRDRKVGLVHVRSRAPAWSAYWACRMTSCPFVTTNHAAYKFSNPFKKFYNSVMVKADRIIAISSFIAAHIRKNYHADAAKIRIIPRGIDFAKFAPEKITEERRGKLRAAWGVAEGQRLTLLPSRLSPIKGQSVLVEAMALSPPELGDVMAVILGDDQGRAGYRRELEDLIAARKLQNRVRLVAHCDDMPAAYSLAALVVAPSLIPEGFGRVPVEAMAMGVPVIASDLGGFTETIHPGANGWLVPPNDPQSLAQAMTKALTQTPEQHAAEAQTAMQQVRARYDKTKMVTDTLAVYDELVRA